MKSHTTFLPGSLANKLIAHKKNIRAFALLTIVAGLLSAGLYFVVHNNTARILQTGIFLLVGYIHLRMLDGNLSILKDTEKFVYTVMITAVVILLTTIFQVVAFSQPLAMAIAAGASFFLPYINKELWRLFQRMINSQPKIWYYTKNLPLQKSTTFLNSIPVRFTLLIDDREEKIAFRAPVRMKLGLLMYHVIQEQNNNHFEPVELNGKGKNNFGWLFYTTGFGGFIKYLDPEASLIENKITGNREVMVKRVNAQISSVSSIKKITRKAI